VFLVDSGIKSVKRNISLIYQRKINATLALCQEYGAMALNRFLQKQNNNEFWKNQTYTALDTVFYGTISQKDFVGFFLAHAVEYGVYLELANDRQNEALRPTVMAFYSRFEKDLQEIWG
jgi:hypothetical protein